MHVFTQWKQQIFVCFYVYQSGDRQKQGAKLSAVLHVVKEPREGGTIDLHWWNIVFIFCFNHSTRKQSELLFFKYCNFKWKLFGETRVLIIFKFYEIKVVWFIKAIFLKFR